MDEGTRLALEQHDAHLAHAMRALSKMAVRPDGASDEQWQANVDSCLAGIKAASDAIRAAVASLGTS